ncbi:UBN2_2 domain-containing protein, partial [Cephalotus follicularis]
CL